MELNIFAKASQSLFTWIDRTNLENCICKSYWTLNPFIGCPFKCSFCFNFNLKNTYKNRLKEENNTWYDSINLYIKDLKTDTSFYFGQYQDALAFPDSIKIIKNIIKLVNGSQYAKLILVTKSANVYQLQELTDTKKISIVFSINPNEIIRNFEHGTPRLEDRIKAAQHCQKLGYQVRFQFSPVIPINNWETEYTDMITYLTSKIEPTRITIATLSCFPHALQRLQNGNSYEREAAQLFLNRTPDEDGRIRLSEELRERVYKPIVNLLNEKYKHTELSLCLEPEDIHHKAGLNTNNKCNCIW